MSKGVFQFLQQRGVKGLLLISVLGLVTWFIGPQVSISGVVPLHSQQARLVAILILAFAWGIDNLRVRAKLSKGASSVVVPDDVGEVKRRDSPVAVGGESRHLIERLHEAIKLLGGATFAGSRKLYQIPWYMLIGAPESGKTTMVKSAGLQFPLASLLGADHAQRGDETYTCNWWFTNQAVIIDPAGRYTSQDSPAEGCSRAWLAFLAALRRARSRRPLDGVIVAVSVTDLLGTAPAQRERLAVAIKTRLQELNRQLGVELPIYLLVTKCDRIAGFSEFFADLEQPAREQPWGLPFALTDPRSIGEHLVKIPERYRALLAQAKDRLYVRLKHESDPQRRSLLFDFPQQMLGLEERLQTLLCDIFMPNRFEQPLLLRGIYFVSSLQSSAPGLYASGVLPTALCKAALSSGRDASRSYFLSRLLSDLIFGEAGLARLSRPARRRHQLLFGGALVALLMVFLGVMGAINAAHRANSEYIHRVETALADLEVPPLESSAESLNELLARLDALRMVTVGYEVDVEGWAWTLFGLDQRKRLRAEARHAYLETLSRYLMPMAGQATAAEVRAALGGSDESLLGALHAYLQLFHPEKRDVGALASWAEDRVGRQFASAGDAEQGGSFSPHFRAALEEGFVAPDLDEPLVAEARARLAAVPVERRVYGRLMHALMKESRGEVSLDSLLGDQAQEVFSLRSGRPTEKGVPDFFTYHAFHTTVRSQAYLHAAAAVNDDWVLGVAREWSEEVLAEKVLSLYLDEYAAAWRQFLDDIMIRRFQSIREGQRIVRRLAAGDEPLVQLLLAIRTHTQLDAVPAPEEVTAGAMRAAALRQPRLQNALAHAELPQSLLPGQSVADAFKDLNRFIDPAEGLGLRRMQEALVAVAFHMDQLALAQLGPDQQAAPTGVEGRNAIGPLESALAVAPPIVRGWFENTRRDVDQASAQGVAADLNAAWRRDVMPFYERSIKHRYPLNSEAKVEVRLEDFTEFFGPGGIVARFLADHVAAYADVSGSEWRMHSPVGLSRDSLRLLQRLKHIEEVWFDGETKPQVAFGLLPRELDATVVRATVDVGGQAVEYGHGPVRHSALRWPGEPGIPARLRFDRVDDDAPVNVHEGGEWAWFRLLDRYGQVTKEHASGNLLLAFSVHGLNVSYELKPGSAHHPFTRNLLRNLALPQQL